MTVINKQGGREQPLGFFIGIKYAAHQILDPPDQLQAQANVGVQGCQVIVELSGKFLDGRKPSSSYPAIAQIIQKQMQLRRFVGKPNENTLARLLSRDRG